MNETNITLAIMIEGWQAYQNNLSKALAPLSDEQLALRAGSNLRSIDELARHLIAVRAGWYHNFLREGDDSFDAISHWDEPGHPSRTASELVNGMAITWRLMQDALAQFSATNLQVVFTNDSDSQKFSQTRGWVVWHVIEHDLHHGGEISYSLGMHGLKAPNI